MSWPSYDPFTGCIRLDNKLVRNYYNIKRQPDDHLRLYVQTHRYTFTTRSNVSVALISTINRRSIINKSIFTGTPLDDLRYYLQHLFVPRPPLLALGGHQKGYQRSTHGPHHLLQLHLHHSWFRELRYNLWPHRSVDSIDDRFLGIPLLESIYIAFLWSRINPVAPIQWKRSTTLGWIVRSLLGIPAAEIRCS